MNRRGPKRSAQAPIFLDRTNITRVIGIVARPLSTAE